MLAAAGNLCSQSHGIRVHFDWLLEVVAHYQDHGHFDNYDDRLGHCSLLGFNDHPHLHKVSELAAFIGCSVTLIVIVTA